MYKNEKGITLVEVLAVLLISSIVAGGIYTLVTLTMNHSAVETTKTRLQQEANYIVTEIQRIHRQCDSYTLKIETGSVEIKNCIDAQDAPIENMNKIISNTFNYDPKLDVTIIPKSENYILTNFIVKDPNNEKLKVEINTEFSRYLSE